MQMTIILSTPCVWLPGDGGRDSGCGGGNVCGGVGKTDPLQISLDRPHRRQDILFCLKLYRFVHLQN